MSMRQSGGATRDSLPQAISYCRKNGGWVYKLQEMGEKRGGGAGRG